MDRADTARSVACLLAVARPAVTAWLATAELDAVGAGAVAEACTLAAKLGLID
jgi:hypothetical protein